IYIDYSELQTQDYNQVIERAQNSHNAIWLNENETSGLHKSKISEIKTKFDEDILNRTKPLESGTNIKHSAHGVVIPQVTVLFETRSSSLSNEAIQELDKIVAVMKDYPDAIFEIDGYASITGNNNQELSEQRAVAIKNYFVNQGIDESRLLINSHSDLEADQENHNTEDQKGTVQYIR
ncbi:MAG: OmpA family protein, partial [Crenarchaeota archaeon]|nr:OmpA family protein [Thermoproteota archaeon]